MIKKTIISCTSTAEAPNLILIPGGPGLSSHSIRGFDVLSRSFHLHYIDYPGANGQVYERDYLFEEVSEVLNEYAERLRGDTFAVGHSYGGLLAVDAGVKANLSGVICVGTPFTNQAMDLAVKNYSELKSDRLRIAEGVWERGPTDKALSNWLSEYGVLYFTKKNIDSGRKLLSNDPASSQFFIANQPDTRRLGSGLLSKIAATKIPRLLISGADDQLLSSVQLKADALKAGFKCAEVPDAGHFIMFDQPESVARLIEEFTRQ